MRNYWVKIIGKAFGIFVVGMLVITGVRSVKSSVNSTINSSDPISIPLIGLIPFRVDNDKLGSLRRVELLRESPEAFSGVRVLVKLADSVSPERLRSCVLVVDDIQHLNERSTFRCQAPGAELAGVEQFGSVVLQGLSDSFPLLLPSGAVADIRRTMIHMDGSGIHVKSTPDPARVALEARLDSMRNLLDARVEARSDSVDDLRELADELEDSAATLAAAPRRGLQRRADSTRAEMRAVMDRMKADEVRLEAVNGMSAFSPLEVDSLARANRQLGDSVRQIVARELQRAAIELERSQGAPASTVVGAPAAPALPAPPAVRP